MSLLMDALRRAETAGSETPHDTAQTTLPEAIEQPASNTPLQLEPLETDNAETIDSTAEPTAEVTGAATAQTDEADAGSPQQARSALEAFARRKSSLRKRLVFAGSGLLSAAALLAGYYYWQTGSAGYRQVASTAALIDSPQVEPGATAGVSKAPGTPLTADSSSSADEEPVSSVSPAPSASQAVAPADEPPVTGAPAPQASPRAAQENRIEIHRTRQTSRVPENLRLAYEAYSAGDYAQAETLYRQVLRTYPDNRDAMLGLAAISLHQGNRRVAGYYYERLLKADPSDKTALLALQGLSGGQYSLESGSKLKYWLQTDRDNAQLHFALGNQYAASGQWKEAQQSYFEAHRLAPASADYAFNLAVSLDMLGLGEQALGFYLQARKLADHGGALFSTAQLENRIRQLQAAGEKAR